MAVYSLAPLLGPAIGPMVGGWIVQELGQWRWIFWVSSMYGALTAVVGFILLPETYAPTLLRKKAAKIRNETGNEKVYTIFDVDEPWHARFRHNLIRPFILLATQPIIQVLSAYMAVMYGCMYLLLTVFPVTFSEIYNERPGIASLNYISLAFGFTFGGQLGGPMIDRIYRKLRQKNGGVGRPEFKLPVLMATAALVPIGLLIYGWTADYKTHWMGPNVGAAIFAAGTMCSFLVVQGYLVDVMPLFAASVLAAAVFVRSLGGFVFPLFADSMYDALGQGWGVSARPVLWWDGLNRLDMQELTDCLLFCWPLQNSLLALVSGMLGIPAPFLLWRWGPYLRSKSQYAAKERGAAGMN